MELNPPTKPCFLCRKPVSVSEGGMLMTPDGSRSHDCGEGWMEEHGYAEPAARSSLGAEPLTEEQVDRLIDEFAVALLAVRNAMGRPSASMAETRDRAASRPEEVATPLKY